MRSQSTARADRLCANTARHQFGLVTRRQAHAAGLDDSSIHRRVRAGLWRRVMPEVWALAGSPNSHEQRTLAAILWAGRGSAVSHGTAAWRHGFPSFAPTPLEISTVRDLRPRSRPLVVHRVDDGLIDEVALVGELPVTSVRRTLLDLAGRTDPRTEAALDHALRTGRADLASLWALVDNPRCRGRRGSKFFRNLLAERSPEWAPTDSELELLALRLLRAAGLPRPITQFPVELPGGMVKLDLAYPEIKLGIELDGYAWHHSRAAFDGDRRRDVELGVLGWLVLRFSWWTLRFQPELMIRSVSHHLDARRAG